MVGSTTVKKIILIGDGNSLIADTKTGDGRIVMRSYLQDVLAVIATPNRNIAYENYAVGGQTTTQMLVDQPNQIIGALDPNAINIVVIQEGTNDMHLNNLTAQQAFDRLTQYSRNLINSGIPNVFPILIAATPRNNPPPGYLPVPSSFDWQGLNTLIRQAMMNVVSKQNAGISEFADIATIPEIGGDRAQDNPIYYPDGIHFWTEQSYRLIVPLVAQAIERILARV